MDPRTAAATVLRTAARQIEQGDCTVDVDTTVERLLARHCGGGYLDLTDLGQQLPADASPAWEQAGAAVDAALRAVGSPALTLLPCDWRGAAALRTAAQHLDGRDR